MRATIMPKIFRLLEGEKAGNLGGKEVFCMITCISIDT
jgi:hypothetical protein